MTLISQYKGLRREIYVLFFGRIVTSLGSMVWPLLTLILSRKLGMNATRIALISVASGLVFLPASAIGGKLADRFNKKMVIVWCDLISIFFYITCSILPVSIYTVIMVMVAGAVQQLEYPAYNSLVADLSLSKDRERAYSLEYLGMNMGLVFAPTIAGLLFENYLWVAFLSSGVSIAVSTILIFLLIKDITPVEETDEGGEYQKRQDQASLLTVLKQNKLILLYAFIMMLYWGAYGQYGYLMPLDMGNLHGENGAVIYGSVSSLNSIIVVLFTPILTRIFHKVVPTKKALMGHTFLLFGFITFLVFRGTVGFYYLAMFLFTLGEIMMTFTEGPYLTTRIPASHRGRINGIMSIAQSILSGILMLVLGYFYDNQGPATSWTIVICILSVSLILCALLTVLDKKAYPALYN